MAFPITFEERNDSDPLAIPSYYDPNHEGGTGSPPNHFGSFLNVASDKVLKSSLPESNNDFAFLHLASDGNVDATYIHGRFADGLTTDTFADTDFCPEAFEPFVVTSLAGNAPHPPEFAPTSIFGHDFRHPKDAYGSTCNSLDNQDYAATTSLPSLYCRVLTR